MKGWQIAACALLAGAHGAAAASDKPALELKSSSEWVLDYAEERCTLFRAFGQDQDALVLRIDSFGSATNLRVLVTGPTVPNLSDATSDMTIRFTPDAEDRPTAAINGKVGDQPGVSFSISPRPYEDPAMLGRLSGDEKRIALSQPRAPTPEFEAQIRSLQMRFRNGRSIRLALGSMAKPLAAMRECLDNLQTSWGLNPQVQKGLTRLAFPKPSTVRRVQARYPQGMLSAGAHAYVPVRVMVDPDGRATACVVQNQLVEADFKKAVCRGLMDDYVPALDAAGSAVASMYQTSVFYITQ